MKKFPAAPPVQSMLARSICPALRHCAVMLRAQDDPSSRALSQCAPFPLAFPIDRSQMRERF